MTKRTDKELTNSAKTDTEQKKTQIINIRNETGDIITDIQISK